MPAQGRSESHFLSFPVFVDKVSSEMETQTKTDEKIIDLRTNPADDRSCIGPGQG
jgi:hypothetical protein